jgi:hypothetical protein
MTTKYTYNYNVLEKYINENKITLNKDYSEAKVTRDTFIEGKCLTSNCENNFSKTFRQLKKSEAFCEVCSKVKRYKKSKDTCLKKYGVEYVLQVKEIKDKCNKVIKEKYNVENISQLDEIKEKKIKTCQKNHGVNVSFESNEIKNKIKDKFIKKYGVDNPFKSEIIKETIKNTNLIKYGHENPQQNNDIKQKTKNTCLQKYGYENVLLLEKVIETRKQICFEKYGTDYFMQSELGKNIYKQTCLHKYGVENPQQVPEIAEKGSKNSYRSKLYTFPSGKQISCQGYEPFALNKLIKDELINETDIVTGAKNVPIIWYNDETGKKHCHYVDIFIPSQNRMIEVKSTWTAEKKKDNIFLKQEAGKNLGYLYEIWVYNNKGIIVKCIS